MSDIEMEAFDFRKLGVGAENQKKLIDFIVGGVYETAIAGSIKEVEQRADGKKVIKKFEMSHVALLHRGNKK